MKRSTICIAATLAATLAVAPMVGCGNQGSSDSGSSAETTETSATTESAESTEAAADQSQDATLAELKDKLAKVPEYKSVTIVATTLSTVKSDAEADAAEATGDDISTTTTYKFDESGDELKTQVSYELDDVKMQYFSTGSDAVCVTDGPVYSGTIDQFDETAFKGSKAVIEDQFGDFNTLVDCAASVEKSQEGDITSYKVTLDPQKYIASDETLTMMAEYGDAVVSSDLTLGFDADGHLANIDQFVEYAKTTVKWSTKLSDFDSTVLDPMPEATRTYEEMQEDINLKTDALAREMEAYDESEATDESKANDVAEVDTAETAETTATEAATE